jgi:hypothetical protein
MQKAFSFYPMGGTELAEKMKSCTEQNISAARDFMHKLSQARDCFSLTGGKRRCVIAAVL